MRVAESNRFHLQSVDMHTIQSVPPFSYRGRTKSRGSQGGHGDHGDSNLDGGIGGCHFDYLCLLLFLLLIYEIRCYLGLLLSLFLLSPWNDRKGCFAKKHVWIDVQILKY
jgi:hypothetical protein